MAIVFKNSIGQKLSLRGVELRIKQTMRNPKKKEISYKPVSISHGAQSSIVTFPNQFNFLCASSLFLILLGVKTKQERRRSQLCETSNQCQKKKASPHYNLLTYVYGICNEHQRCHQVKQKANMPRFLNQ